MSPEATQTHDTLWPPRDGSSEPLVFAAFIYASGQNCVRTVVINNGAPIRHGALLGTSWRLIVIHSGRKSYWCPYEQFHDAGVTQGNWNWVRTANGDIVSAQIYAPRLSLFQWSLLNALAGAEVAPSIESERIRRQSDGYADLAATLLYDFYRKIMDLKASL